MILRRATVKISDRCVHQLISLFHVKQPTFGSSMIMHPLIFLQLQSQNFINWFRKRYISSDHVKSGEIRCLRDQFMEFVWNFNSSPVKDQTCLKLWQFDICGVISVLGRELFKLPSFIYYAYIYVYVCTWIIWLYMIQLK